MVKCAKTRSLLPTYTVVNPWTVMIKLGYTAIADRAMLGAERFLNDARVTELTEVKCMTFRQIKYHLQALLSILYLITDP